MALYGLSYNESLELLSYYPRDSEYIELWSRVNDQDEPWTDVEHGQLQDSAVGNWLAKHSPSDSLSERKSRPGEGSPHCSRVASLGGLRLLLSYQCENDPIALQNRPWSLKNIPFSREVFEKIIEAFSIPRKYAEVVSHVPAYIYRTYIHDAEGRSTGLSYIFKTRNNRNERRRLAITYDTATHVTYGVLHGITDKWRYEVFLKETQEQAQSFIHPMFIPALVTKLAISECYHYIETDRREMYSVELATGQNIWLQDSRNRNKDFIPEELDLVSLTRRLNGIMSSLCVTEVNMKSQGIMLQKIGAYMEELLEHISDPKHKEKLRATGKQLSEMIENVTTWNEILLFEAQSLQRRAQTQLAVVYNYIAQKDSKVNVEVARDSKEIAAESKRDSSAMKTIAVLTIVFLPGTFVAALFSMSMFNWQTEITQEILSPWLWIYWAVTVPLTIVVILVWYIWIRRTDILHRDENLARVNSLDHNIGQQSFVNSRVNALGSKQGSIISSARAQAPEQEQGKTSMRFRPFLQNLRVSAGLNTANEKQNIA